MTLRFSNYQRQILALFESFHVYLFSFQLPVLCLQTLTASRIAQWVR